MESVFEASMRKARCFDVGKNKNKGHWLRDSGPLSLHARRSANEQPTGEAERLAGPRAGPVGLPR